MAIDVIRCPGCGVKMDLSVFPVRPQQVICPRCHTRSAVPGANYPANAAGQPEMQQYQEYQAPSVQTMQQMQNDWYVQQRMQQQAEYAQQQALYAQQQMQQQQQQQAQQLQQAQLQQAQQLQQESQAQQLQYQQDLYTQQQAYPTQYVQQQLQQQIQQQMQQTQQQPSLIQQQPASYQHQNYAGQQFPGYQDDYALTGMASEEAERALQELSEEILGGETQVMNPALNLPTVEEIAETTLEAQAALGIANPEDETLGASLEMQVNVESAEPVSDSISYEDTVEEILAGATDDSSSPHDVAGSSDDNDAVVESVSETIVLGGEQAGAAVEETLAVAVSSDGSQTEVLTEVLPEALSQEELHEVDVQLPDETLTLYGAHVDGVDKIVGSYEEAAGDYSQTADAFLLPIDQRGNTEPFAFALIGLFSVILMFPPIGICLCILALAMCSNEKRFGLYNAYRRPAQVFAVLGLILNIVLLVLEIFVLTSFVSAPAAFIPLLS